LPWICHTACYRDGCRLAQAGITAGQRASGPRQRMWGQQRKPLPPRPPRQRPRTGVSAGQGPFWLVVAGDGFEPT
jgi:hypothetical protein